MEMNYFKKTGKMMVAACMLAGLPFIPGTVSASELQTQMMSVQMESTTLKELFDLIEEKFNYTFLIRNNDINLNERISIDMSNRSVEEILTTALKNQHADFVVNNNRIVVYKSSSNPNELRNTERMVAQQTITISGTIVDAVTGEPVIGANVLVKGTTNGTSTDFDGKFSLEAPAGATLVVSYIGYVNHEVKATSAPMTIRIKEDTQNLEEVVVVGYGVQKKESLTGAMQVVSNEKLLDATSPTVENLLSGKAPGVQVTSGGGQPGAAGKVVIRGKSTVNGSTDPLWIVDGVIVGTDAGSLNPADIESMSILKDAASTAIYGSQGANGVIVVTTKKGKIGKATINASVKMGVNQLHRGNMNMMNGEELYDYYKSFANQDALPSYFTEDLRNRNFDWWKEGTHLGFAQDYNVSVSGGSEKIKTYTFIQAATNDRVPCIFIENGRGVNLDPNDPLYVSYKENFPGEPTGKDNPELLRMLPSVGHAGAIVNGVPRIGFQKGGKTAQWKDEDMAELFLEKAKGFMKENKDKPFFLYYGLHQPHVPRVPNERFAGKSGMGPRGDVILEADWCVTEFLKEMDKLGLTENTLVVFTSDNGPVLDDGYQDQAVELVGDHKMAGPLRGGKTSLYDGGTCIPFMLRWPAEVKPGAVSDALVCQMDLLASLSALIGQTYSDKVDSQNTLPVFLGKGGNGRKELVLEGYFNYALRDGDWVMIPPYPDTYGDAEEAAFAGNSNCYQLYNVKEDIGQQVNLAEKEPKRLRQMMMTFERLKRETGKITNF